MPAGGASDPQVRHLLPRLLFFGIDGGGGVSRRAAEIGRVDGSHRHHVPVGLHQSPHGPGPIVLGLRGFCGIFVDPHPNRACSVLVAQGPDRFAARSQSQRTAFASAGRRAGGFEPFRAVTIFRHIHTHVAAHREPLEGVGVVKRERSAFRLGRQHCHHAQRQAKPDHFTSHHLRPFFCSPISAKYDSQLHQRLSRARHYPAAKHFAISCVAVQLPGARRGVKSNGTALVTNHPTSRY